MCNIHEISRRKHDKSEYTTYGTHSETSVTTRNGN